MRVLQWCRAKTPSVSIQPEFIDDHEGTGNTQQITAKDIDNDVVPPAFLEIVEHIPQGVLNQLEGNRGKEDEF